MGARREFCEQFLAPENVNLFQQYTKLRETCEWEELDRDEEELNFMYRWYPDDKSYAKGHDAFVISGDFNRERGQVPDARYRKKVLKLQRCRQTVAHGDLVGEWVFERMGPMVGRGGNDWHQFMWVNDYDRMPERVEQNMEITGWYLSTVDKVGVPIGHPPVHAHHSHLNPEGCWYDPRDALAGPKAPKSVLAQTHGDSQCTDKEGGMACLLNILPKGYGYSIQDSVHAGALEPEDNQEDYSQRRKLCLDSELNDVRPPDSPPMEFYFESSLRFQPKRPKPLSFMSIGNTQYHCHTCGQWNQNGVYFFNPRLGAAIEYYQVQVDRSGSLLWSFIHSHQSWAQTIWMFKGQLNDFGLHHNQYDEIQPASLRREFRTDRKKCANVLPMSRSALRDAKGYIMSKARASNQADQGQGPIICRQDGVPNQCHGDKWYDRQSAMVCPGQWNFRKGDWVTFVAFHEDWNTAASEAQGVGANGAVPVHIIWRMMYTPTRPAGSTYKFIIAYAGGANGPDYEEPVGEFPAASLSPLQKSRDLCPKHKTQPEGLTETKATASSPHEPHASPRGEGESKSGGSGDWSKGATALQGLRNDKTEEGEVSEADRVFGALLTGALVMVAGMAVVVYWWTRRQDGMVGSSAHDNLPFTLVPSADDNDKVDTPSGIDCQEGL